MKKISILALLLVFSISLITTPCAASQVTFDSLYEYGEEYLNENFDSPVDLNFHNGANAISSNDKATASSNGTAVEVTGGKLKFTRLVAGQSYPDLPVKFDLKEKVSGGLVAVSADVKFEANSNGSSYYFSIGQLANPITPNYTQIDGNKTCTTVTSSLFTTEKKLTVLIDLDNNEQSMWIDGVLYKEDIANTQYSSGLEFLVLKIPRAYGVCNVYVDNLTAHKVTKKVTAQSGYENFNDESADGFTLSSSATYLKESDKFGYDKYLSTGGTVVYDYTIAPTGNDYKTIFNADIKAKPGTVFDIIDDGGNPSLSVEFEKDSTQIQWTDQSDNVGTYEENKWYNINIEITHISNSSEVKSANLYIDGNFKGTAYFDNKNISSFKFAGDTIVIDNFRITTLNDGTDFSDMADFLELRHEIQYAKDLVAYYGTKNMNSNTESVESRYFVDATGATEESGYLGGTYYTKYKSAITEAEGLYTNPTLTASQAREAINKLWESIGRVGGDIRELRFDDALNTGYIGNSSVVADSIPSNNGYVMQIKGDGYFSFAPTPIGTSNLSTWGTSSRFNISFDFKMPSSDDVVISLGNRSENECIFEIKLSPETGKMYYYKDNQWNDSGASLTVGQWYSLYIDSYMVDSKSNLKRHTTLSIDGEALNSANQIAFLSVDANAEISEIYIDIAENPMFVVDNILVMKQYSNLPAGDRGLLGKRIREAHNLLEGYKNKLGEVGGQVPQSQYSALQNALNNSLGRYTVNKTLRVTALNTSYEFTKQITKDATAIATAIDEFNASVIPYADWYLRQINYEDTNGNKILSAGKGDKISSVDILRYAENVNSATLFVATYKGEKMLQCKPIPLTDEIEIGVTTPVEVDLTVTEDECEIKCFIFNGQTLVPLTAAPLENEKLKDGIIKICVLGDSISAPYSESAAPQTGIGQVLSNYFDSERAVVENYARGGHTTQISIDNGYYNMAYNSASEGDYLIISFGHNDSKGDNMLEKTVYKKNLKYMVETASEKGIKVIFFTPPARLNTTSESVVLQQKLTEYSQAMIEVANELKVPVFDLNAKTTAEVLSEADGYMSRYMYSVNGADGSHLTYYGADLYAGYIINALKDLRHPLSALFVEHTVNSEGN